MCGIAGFAGFDDRRLLEAMTDALIHRGPDDEGFYVDKHVSLGMRRLSIIDFQGGHQPIHNEDKTVWVVFNGEIYNFIELREELAKKGHSGYSPDTIRFIPNGVDTERMDPTKISGQSIRKEFGVENRFLVVAGGRMTPEKDHAMFLKALARVKAAIPDVKALLIGEGPLQEELQNLAVSLGLKDTCFFPGFRSDIPEILGAADLFVLSSVSEGMPFMVLEALALETPVVATDVYGVSDIIRHNQEGLLVPARSPDAMADSIVTLLKDSTQARHLGKAGRKHVQTYHSTQKIIQMWQDLYQQDKHMDG